MFEITVFTASWLIPLIWYISTALIIWMIAEIGGDVGMIWSVILGTIWCALFILHLCIWVFKYWNEWHIFIVK